MFDSPLAALVVVMMVNFKLKEKHKNLLEIKFSFILMI